MIRSLLIANRGEIACRVIRTARRLGVRTVAVYSDADAKALHVRQADEAVHIGPSPARESYLRGEAVIAAAKGAGAEAIHPGYGFLSENADFAQSVLDAGLIWVGPPPVAIRAMGLKDAAKRLMMAAGVPTTPGYLGDDQGAERLRAEADAVGYPVLIKAVAGGGGKGMRRVDRPDDFLDALSSCRREAAAAFGDDRVLLERYLARPRHIEVQVFGDSYGNVVHLFERDCSLQRRHQKVIEEAPAPGMGEEARAAICAAAVRAAKAVDYVGAGTVEFIADASEGLRADRTFFMEMNTRLQVEHPVTEMITGVDLVEWQLRVASGEPLPLRQEDLRIDGHAIEARLYAEDPAKGFLPSVGRLEVFRPRSRVQTGIREDFGVEQDDDVSPFYDPMIGKLIVHRPTRTESADYLAEQCAALEIWPVKTNAPFLLRALTHPAFVAGDVTTGFIPEHDADLIPDSQPTSAMLEHGAVALLQTEVLPGFWTRTLRGSLSEQQASADQFTSPWRQAVGLRLNAPPMRTVHLTAAGEQHSVTVSEDWRDSQVRAERYGNGQLVSEDGETILVEAARYGGQSSSAAVDGAILAPMPGRVTAVEVAPGARVAKGQRLVTLEAMKMEHGLVAPFDGMVAELPVAAGAQVSEGTLLARVKRGE